jgi:hypothetical protein
VSGVGGAGRVGRARLTILGVATLAVLVGGCQLVPPLDARPTVGPAGSAAPGATAPPADTEAPSLVTPTLPSATLDPQRTPEIPPPIYGPAGGAPSDGPLAKQPVGFPDLKRGRPASGS